MAVDRSRLAAALAYRQAEEERRRRMMESVPVPGAELPNPVPSQNLRQDLENLSIGVGEGLTRQLEGVKGIVTDPVGAARGAYEGVKAVVRDPSIIADALRYTAQKVGSGPLGAGEVIGEMIGPRKTGPTMAELDVYHGTPHRFPATEANPLGEFDASKIGTGEGAQAYGHGVYLAESPDVAKDYQVRLSYDPDKMRVGGKQINDLYEEIRKKADRLPSEKAVGEYEKMDLLERLMNNRTVDDVKKYASELSPATQKWFSKQVEPTFETYGAFYKADLPDEMIDRMLDYDKPLTQQPKNVQAALAKLGDPQEKLDAYDDALLKALFEDAADPGSVPRNPSGADILSKLENQYGRKGASDYLRGLGIPGVRYLDAGSRGQGGSGTRNFVVFPGEEKKVRILERDGKKVAEMLQRTAPASAEVEVDLYPLRGDSNTLYLSKIAVPEGQRGQGLGTKAMQDVIARADAEGKRVVLSPSTEYGATSVGRLKDFYKRFGFVENKGRNKNYAVSQTMYRDPKKPK